MSDIQLERIQDFEDRLGIRFEKISIKVEDYGGMVLYAEVHPTSGQELKQDVNIECVLYDSSGGIIGKERTFIFSDDFFGFEVVDFYFNDEGIEDRLGMIKLYPKKG